MATPMQKLLWPATLQAYLREGSALLVGPAVRIADAIGWTTPQQVLGAYGIPSEGVPSVDVLRFEPTPVTSMSVPEPGSPAAAAGYELGFLNGAGGVVPVWDVAPTEVPQGAEIWRIHADGRQELVSAYGGPAFGWRSTGVYAPPSMAVGPRAEWGDQEYFASWVDDAHIELVMVADAAPDGFEQTRPRVFRRVVPVDDCTRIFENSFIGKWNSVVPCAVVQATADEASVLLDVDAARADAFGAVMLEPGVFWKSVPRVELDGVQATTTEWDAQ